MKTAATVSVAALLLCLVSVTGCTTITDEHGKTHKVLNVPFVNSITETVATSANMVFPGSGVIVQGIGALIAMFGLSDIRRKRE